MNCECKNSFLSLEGMLETILLSGLILKIFCGYAIDYFNSNMTRVGAMQRNFLKIIMSVCSARMTPEGGRIKGREGIL